MSTPFPLTRPARAWGRAAVFFLKVFPMLPSGLIDRLTPAPVIEPVTYPTTAGAAQGELYRPPGPGPHPGILVCLGVVPFGVDHPQVPVLGRALSRAGLAALLYWSPAMRDFRLDPADVDNLALAYDWLVRRPDVDPARSGLMGTCVGGSFALMAAAHERVRDRIAFASAYAPFSSMTRFAGDIASATRDDGAGRVPWKVDQLTRRVFVHSLTAWLDPAEAEPLRAAYAGGVGAFDPAGLSPRALAVQALLCGPDPRGAELAVERLPVDLRARLDELSPLNHLAGLRAPLVSLLHDAGDQVIPVGESRRLVSALGNRPGLRYTEMNFSHLDPVKGKLPPHRLVIELGKFFRAMYPIFRQTT